ncbi:MAG: hypothetical protein OSJ60_14655 [Lachnospiraceae bacterium]|jgi:hypothetical protein|nr:hypothetical protein C819_02716 [Lachnospiraceae bacterium 10-1]MCX4352862.1 hypothetical protein [Lachnospiraceae bacterium]
MSESVKIGGIGKNPAIDKINNLNSIDIKNYAVKKMEELLIRTNVDGLAYGKKVPIDFTKVDWEGSKDGK